MNVFYVCNGNELFSLDDLLNELKTIDDGSFSQHVNNEKNDFANWVLYEFNDKILSKQLSKNLDRKKMIKSVQNKINKILELKKKKEIIDKIKGEIENG